MLYQLYRSTSKTMSTIAAYSRLTMAIIMGINLINYLVPAFIYSHGENMFTNIDINLQHDIASLFFYAHKIGEYCWQLFFSIHLFTLGLLIQKSIFVPKKIGTAMLIGSFGYFLQSMFFILDIHINEISFMINVLLTIAVIGELSFTFWLLIKGINNNNSIDLS